MSIVSQRGYSISKQTTDPALLEHHRQQLTIVPHVEREEYAHLTKPIAIYQETANRLYMPRFYGLREIGRPDTDKLWSREYEACPRLKFRGSLRDNQMPVVDVALKSLEERGGGVISISCGSGKCVSVDTPILMYDGTIKKVQDVVVGDMLMGDDSTPRRVLTLARGREMMYDIVPTKGDTYTVNESHILSLKCSTNGTHGKKGDVVDMALLDYLKLPASYHGRAGNLLGYRVGVDFHEQQVLMDPYLLGAWLGDGGTKQTVFTTDDDELADYLKTWVKTQYPDGRVKVVRGTRSATTRHECHYALRTPERGKNHFRDLLQQVGIWDNKHIPHVYKCNSREVRLKVLAGLLDTDGSLAHNGYDIIQKRKVLAEDITFLARSLGFAAYMKQCQKTCTNAKDGPKKGTYYRVSISGAGLEHLPVLLKRKKAAPRRQIKDALVTRIKVVQRQVDDYYGFTIDGNHRFLLGDFTVTHNTVLALYLGCQLNAGNPPPMAVVCHTTAMMKQWQERIHDFVPTARIGLVQRDQLVIEDRDIIIMSVKTVANRKYSKHAFERIGLVVWDEIHLMCTRTFSKAFPKLATKYTLGLSATPYRKDQCDAIFQNYIGPVVYMRKRPKNAEIEAYCVTFLMDDIELSLNKYHKIMYTPTCVSTVNRPERSQYVAKLVGQLAGAGRTVLVLGEYVTHLETLNRLITEMQFCKLIGVDERVAFMMAWHPRLGAASPLRVLPRDIGRYICSFAANSVTTGLYIGKMKNEDRKVSESKDVILGTYKLASVGMDIPSLNTLVFASPRKEIEQSVGRILRKQHAGMHPMIIDIIDNHSMFKSQAQVRKKFYRQYGYTIVHQQVEVDGTIKSTRRTKAKIKAVDVGGSPPESDESGGEECLF